MGLRDRVKLPANWPALRRLALVRDRFTCQRCGTREATRLEVHHKRGRERNALADLETLCADCHLAAHGKRMPYGHWKKLVDSL